MRRLRASILLCALMPGTAGPAAAQSSGCAASLAPLFADPPAVRSWRPADRDGPALAATCLGWRPDRFQQMVALAGRFRFDDNADALVGRFGDIGSLAGLRFWSVLKQRWMVWITRATAVTGPDGATPRPNFAADELRDGREAFFAEEDTGSSNRVVYRLRVTRWRPDQVVVEVENVTPVRFLLVELFAPGELRFGYVLLRLAPDSWGFYGLVRTGAGANWLASGHEDGYENRLAAVFRHIAGIPSDREPPVVRGQPLMPASERDMHG